MKGKTAKRAKIMLPKTNRALSSSPTASTERIASDSEKAAASGKQISSSTLQDGPVIPPNEIRLVFETEFSTIREDGEQFSEREMPTFNEIEAGPIQGNFDVLLSTGNLELVKATNASAMKCNLAENHRKGCSVCFKGEPKEIGSGQFVMRQPRNSGGPFCSSFREDITRVPEKMQFRSEKSISMVAGPSNKRFLSRSSVASNSGRNLLTSLSELEETNNLFGVGLPEEEIIKLHDSASQHEFRYYDGIRQRYCSSFKGNGFDVPGIIRLPFETNTSMSTIVDSVDEQPASDSFESDEETLQNPAGTIEDSVDSIRNSNSMPPPLKTIRQHIEPFCSSFRPSISREPSHMTFNQEKTGPTLRPRKPLVRSDSEEDVDEDNGVTLTEDADKEYLESNSETSYEEAEVGTNKCAWMEAHLLSCVVCSSVDTNKVANDVHDSEFERVLKTKIQFNCGRCGKSFRSKRILNQHISTVHEDQRSHQCSQCNKSFGQKGTLKKHVLTVHEGAKAFACSICEKKFGHKGHLETHKLTVHEKRKPHVCPRCDKSFGRKDTLAVHLRRHHRVKPHTCSECSKSFTQKGDLTVHLRIHAGSKPFRCNECSSAFTHKSTLTNHMIAHTNEKPFQCTNCEKRYKSRSGLWRHEKTHTADNEIGSDSQ